MRWTLSPEPNAEITQKLAHSLGIETILAKLLVQRGITSFEQAKTFFRPSFDDLHDPFLMKDMDRAVTRIEKAISQQESILVYGDYDVDGTTSVSLMASYLKTRHPAVGTYIPDRYAEGYGVSFQGIDFAADNEVSLIIALDCGIKALEKVAYAREKGIDFIICDHHRPGKELPDAVAVLDPKRADCQYPYEELCGCGVGFKLVQALASKQGQTPTDLRPYIDLVAVAIAADIVPITGENRTLAFLGLQVINQDPRTGIKAMIHQLKKDSFSITDVVFLIAPRINAAGRIKHGNHAVELLMENDLKTALNFAGAIEENNQQRKVLDKTITREALQQIEADGEQDCAATVVYAEHWHKGVIGIVASRLIETHYRPTVVFTKSGDTLTASARSVKGFDLYKALEACSTFIEQFGGHTYAAGLTIKEENYPAFKAAFETVVNNSLPEALRSPEISIDAEISLSQLTPKCYRILQQMAPFGPQNRQPVFSASGLRDDGRGKKIVGADQSHIRLSIYEGVNTRTFSAIGFGLAAKEPLTRDTPFKAVFCVEENHWNNHTSLQLRLKDIKAEE